MPYIEIGQIVLDDLRKDVSRWITDWVNLYHDDLGSKPCPFAHTALVRGAIDWQMAADADQLRSLLHSLSSDGLTNEVVIIGMDRSSVTPFELHDTVDRCNKDVLIPAGIVALEDHPDDIELVNGVIMNQGNWVLILVQRLDSLNAASNHLKSNGYYDRWSEENLNDVVRWRHP